MASERTADLILSRLCWRESQLPPPAQVKPAPVARYCPFLPHADSQNKENNKKGHDDDDDADVFPDGTCCVNCGVYILYSAMGPRVRTQWIQGRKIYCNRCFSSSRIVYWQQLQQHCAAGRYYNNPRRLPPSGVSGGGGRQARLSLWPVNK